MIIVIIVGTVAGSIGGIGRSVLDVAIEANCIKDVSDNRTCECQFTDCDHMGNPCNLPFAHIMWGDC